MWSNDKSTGCDLNLNYCCSSEESGGCSENMQTFDMMAWKLRRKGHQCAMKQYQEKLKQEKCKQGSC